MEPSGSRNGSAFSGQEPAPSSEQENEAAPDGSPDPARGSWVGIVANRASGTGAGRQLVFRLERELASQGIDAQIAWTPEERQTLVARTGPHSGCRCLVAVGGDGTVSALVNEQPKVPITVLPAGTENLASQHFGLRRNAHWLARTIAAGHVIRSDVGIADGRRFLLMTGFGFDGDVVTRHHRSRTSRSGNVRPTNRAAYVEPILRSSLFYRFPPIHVAITDPGAEEELSGTTVFVFNLPRYALGLPFAPGARQDDGLLDLVVFRDPGPFQALYYLWRVFCRTHLDHPGVYHRRVRRVVLSTDHSVPVQLDGDPAGFLTRGHHGRASGDRTGVEPSSNWIIEAVPGAVDVLVPAPKPARKTPPVPLARTRASR